MRRRESRGGAARVFFACWSAGLIGGVGWLSRAGCETPGAATPTEATRGWRVNYWLAEAQVATPQIAAQLADRGPLPGVREEIHLVGAGGPWSERLRAKGWTVQTAEQRAEPRMEIFGPDGMLRWSGQWSAPEAGGAVLATVVLEKVARGETVPPFVPVGCAVPSAGGARGTGDGGRRPAFTL